MRCAGVLFDSAKDDARTVNREAFKRIITYPPACLRSPSPATMSTSYWQTQPFSIEGRRLRPTAAKYLVRFYCLAVLLVAFALSMWTISLAFPNHGHGYPFSVSLTTVIMAVVGLASASLSHANTQLYLGCRLTVLSVSPYTFGPILLELFLALSLGPVWFCAFIGEFGLLFVEIGIAMLTIRESRGEPVCTCH
jgi:hypothetical protein